MSTSVRLAAAADIPRMVSLINAAFAIETFLAGTRTDEQGLAEMMQKGSFFVRCDQSGNLLATVYVEQRGSRGYFGMLAVDPAYQGQGLGRAMVKAAEDYCRDQGCTVMDLTVLSLRPELLPFYASLGYVKIGAEQFQPRRAIKTGMTCQSIVMSKAL
jgi:GNAT superfamily N-acetyltransferase